jgi:hypothetical protein
VAKLYETLPAERRLEVAVLATGPAGLARTFASYCGQFYDRSEFDALARRASDLYAFRSAADAGTFRARLDRRLCDRYRAPVAWGVGAPDFGRVA